jgi:hypothetical protein
LKTFLRQPNRLVARPIAAKNIQPAYVNHVSESDQERRINSKDIQQDVMQRCAAPGAAKQANRSVDDKGGLSIEV